MRKIGCWLILLCVPGIFAANVYHRVTAQDRAAQAAEVDRLDKRVMELHRAGRYAEATLLAERALALSEKVYGPERQEVAGALNNLAELYRLQGNYARAEPLFQRALAIREKVLPGQPLVATTLVSLGLLYRDHGDYIRAERLLMRALEIDLKFYGPEHLEVASDMEHLGSVYFTIHDYKRAAILFQRVLAIREKKLRPDDPSLAASLNNLAMLLVRAKGDLARAAILFQRALEIFKKTYGSGHPEVAKVLNNLGMIAQARSDFARAASFFENSLEIFEKTYGSENPEVATKLNNLAGMYATQGDYERAIIFKQRADEVREKNIIAVLNAGSQQRKQLYLYTIFRETDGTVGMHTLGAPRSAAAARLALTVILQRKGRALDAMSDQIAALRRRANPEDKRLLERLADARSRLSMLQLSNADNLTPDARRAEIVRLEAEEERLEGNISRRSAEFRAIAQPITLDAVRQAVPPDAALVELFIYYPYNTKTAERPYGVPHYVAYILHSKNSVPQWVELGDADGIDHLAEQVRAALRDPDSEDFKQLARALDERVIRPIRKLLGPTRRIFLAPDGALNLVPFASFVDENGQYLIENYSINYLTSGRDLLRLQVGGESREAPKVFADPIYDLSAGEPPRAVAGQKANSSSTSNTNNQLSKDFTARSYSRLPGTAAEGLALSRLFPDATLLMQAEATEAALKRVARPRMLHIATHGFFLGNQPKSAAASLTDGFDLGREAEPPAMVSNENPLLRSGLIFAGFKQQTSGPGEDGVLTSLEVAGLDLWGTKLVVLSACETGLGDVKNGEGVYGLRRSLVLAGSETQVISLWKVSDAETRDLMVAYYTLLQQGAGRTEALRRVQLAMLQGKPLPSPEAASGKQNGKSEMVSRATTKDYRHPYYWSSFIPSGDWRNLAGQER